MTDRDNFTSRMSDYDRKKTIEDAHMRKRASLLHLIDLKRAGHSPRHTELRIPTEHEAWIMPQTPALVTYGQYKPPVMSFTTQHSLGGHEDLAPEVRVRALRAIAKNYARIFLQDPKQLDTMVMRGLKLEPSHLYGLQGMINHSIVAREATPEGRERMCRYLGARLAIRVSRRLSGDPKRRRCV